MPEVVVRFDEATAEQLDVERELLGFDSRAEYLAWIVENRAAIDKGTERERLLSAYEDRIEALERRLDELETLGSDDTPSTADAPAATTVDSAPSSPTEEPTPAIADDTTPGATDTPPSATTDNTAPAAANETPAAPDANGDAVPAAATDSTETGSATTDSSADLAESETAGGADDTESDDYGLAGVDRIEGSTSVPGGGAASGSQSKSAQEAGVESMHLDPERVSRVSEDTVSEDADVLSGVETDRLDELSRRAVAKTRSQLDRDVETGLSYRSTTSLADSDVRPGDDIADLDSLDLPGRSEETLRKRQEAAGHALAYLRDQGKARRSEFVDALYEQCPAEYGTDDGWWGCIKEALKQVEAVDGGQGTRVWRFDG